MMSSKHTTMTVSRIYSFIERGLKSENFVEWADNNVYNLAKIYEECRGEAYSVVDATHVLFFVQSVCGVADMEDTLDMTRRFIKCQFKDSVV